MKHKLYVWHYRFAKADEDDPKSPKHLLIGPATMIGKGRGWICILYDPRNKEGGDRWLLVHYISIGEPTTPPKLTTKDKHNLILKTWDWGHRALVPAN